MIIKLNYRLLSIILIGIFLFSVIFTVIYTATKAMSEDEIALPVIMYHHISEDRKALNDYVITPKELESDFSYLSSAGYTAILPKELIAYIKKGTPLPEKPVMITFDDGFESVYHYAYPLAEKYDMKFTVAVYGKETEKFSEINDHNILYSYMNWDEIKELSVSGICEIANHTYSLHGVTQRKGIRKNKTEDISTYEKTVGEDLMKLQNRFSEIDVSAASFVYPYGFFCKHSEKLIKNLGFKISFICTEGINKINKTSDCLFNLKRYNRPHGISSKSFFENRNIK